MRQRVEEEGEERKRKTGEWEEDRKIFERGRGGVGKKGRWK